MTPHLKEDPWTEVALDLSRLTGIRGMVDRSMPCEGNVDMDLFMLAVKEIAEGRVTVSKRWLAKLIRKVPWRVLPALSLYETYEQTSARSGGQNRWHDEMKPAAAYWAEQIERGLFVPPGVQMKEDKNEE